MLGNKSVNGVHVPAEEIHPSVVAYDELLNGPLNDFKKTSSEIGGDVKSMVNQQKNPNK